MAALDDPQALVGAVLNRRWKLLRVLGAGGLAVVYEAEGQQGEGLRAIKILRPEFCEEPGVVQRFLDEASTAARIDHPGVARIYEAVRAEDSTPYLVMEVLRGQPLTARMNRGRMPVEQSAPVAHALLLALAAAHQAGVIHRDLKPDNIFLEREESGEVKVKVLDFGIARVLDAAGGLGRKTRTGMMLGTPGYMSPEQVKNTKDADHRADLWAVGVLFYEMLTGVPAFAAENDYARVTAVLFGEPAPIQQVAPQYAHWAPFFQRALAREPAERFQSAQEMADALLTVAREGHMPVPSQHFGNIPMSDFSPIVLGDAPTELAAALAATSPNPVIAAAPQPPVFASVNTAVSAVPGALQNASAPPAPLVQVVRPRRGVSVGLTIAIAVVTLLIGLGAGYLLGAS
jgi:eukaryotic-like serine/threonine-protein kinase